MRIGRRLAGLTALGLGLVLATAPAAQAAYYTGYTTVGSTKDVGSHTAAQGFAAGTTYTYAVKTNSAQTSSVIYRVTKSSKKAVVMKNGDTGGTTNAWLGHGNDMTIVDIDGKHHLYVVTMKESGAQLVKLRYDGTTYRKVGGYYLRLSGKVATMSGISRLSVSSTGVSFLFKKGRTVYRGTAPLTATSGTINLTKAFTLNLEDAKVGGKTISGLSKWSSQGFFYDTAKKVAYFPLWNGSTRSVVLTYKGVEPTSTGDIKAYDALSFSIEQKDKFSKLEIESVAVNGNRLYFNTNRSGNADGVHYFTSYTP